MLATRVLVRMVELVVGSGYSIVQKKIKNENQIVKIKKNSQKPVQKNNINICKFLNMRKDVVLF